MEGKTDADDPELGRYDHAARLSIYEVRPETSRGDSRYSHPIDYIYYDPKPKPFDLMDPPSGLRLQM